MTDTIDTNSVNKQIVRSKFCKQAVSFQFMKHQHCVTCKRQKVSYVKSKPEKSDLEKVKELMPSASDAMLSLIMSQIQNSNKENAKQNRWDRQIMNECLNWYTRSPLSYIQIRQSGLLLLPSPSMLLLYKNSIKHTPGLSTETFRWMDLEAIRMNIPESGRIGGILLDEMSIQQKLEIQK